MSEDKVRKAINAMITVIIMLVVAVVAPLAWIVFANPKLGFFLVFFLGVWFTKNMYFSEKQNKYEEG